MKICFFIGTMIEKGGAERVLKSLTKYCSNFAEVSLLTIINSDFAYEIDKKVNIFYLDKNKIDNYRKQSKVKSCFKYLKRIKRFKQYLKEDKPDVIVSFMPEASFISLLSSKKYNVKKIVSVRNDPKIEFSSKIYKFLMKILYNKADGFVFQTEDAKKYFDVEIQSKSVVIPNPIDESFISNIDNNSKKKKQIISVGRLCEQKNHKMLINAFCDISKKIPDYNLVIYGDGPLRQNLSQLIVDKKMTGKIELPGRIDNIKEKLLESSIFVLCSNYEGMPNALMEAMALGLPVISTDCPCGGPRYLINNNENGILIPICNKKKLTEQLLKLTSNDEFKQKIANNASKIIYTLNPEKVNKKWKDYILNVCDEVNKYD